MEKPPPLASPPPEGTAAVTYGPHPPPAPGERYIHSDIYDRLVSDEDDLIGLVAYGLYQAEKRRWIDQWNATRGHLPSQDEIKAFCFIYDDARLDKLQAESEALIFKATEKRIEQQRSEMVAWAFNGRIVKEFEQLKIKIGATSGYRHHVLAHIMSFAILVGAYAFITFAASHEPTIAGFFESMAGKTPAK